MHAEDLISEGSVEALDIAILRRFTGLNKSKFNTLEKAPVFESFCNKFRPVVNTYFFQELLSK